MKRAIILLVFLILIETISAAELQGNVYDIGLDRVKNAIVEIDTTPLQRVVATQGTYNFKSITPGIYNIKVYTNDKKLMTNETITIKEEGIYTLDLFLIPEFESNGTSMDLSYISIIIIILIMLGVILFLNYRKKPKKEELDKDLDYIINIIKKEGNRATQKDLVQKTGLSEAKISLMITDLESKGIIRKIKKGRANVIILNK